LGIDHTAVLGSTIQEIAWHKAGIMKRGVPAFTVAQPAEAMAVLQARAAEKGVTLSVVDRHPEIEQGQATLGLEADFQKTNASLAVELAAAYLRAVGWEDIKTSPLPPEFKRGLRTVKWGGRCETREEELLTWHIDGGHTLDSIAVAGEWFANRVSPPESTTPPRHQPPRILVFNQQTRAGIPLLRKLYEVVSSALRTDHPFSSAIFCSNTTFDDRGFTPDLTSINTNQTAVEGLDVQHELALGWKEISCAEEGGLSKNIFVARTIEEAIRKCRAIAQAYAEQQASEAGALERTKVLVIGSVHLVGGVLEVLETEKPIE